MDKLYVIILKDEVDPNEIVDLASKLNVRVRSLLNNKVIHFKASEDKAWDYITLLQLKGIIVRRIYEVIPEKLLVRIYEEGVFTSRPKEISDPLIKLNEIRISIELRGECREVLNKLLNELIKISPKIRIRYMRKNELSITLSTQYNQSDKNKLMLIKYLRKIHRDGISPSHSKCMIIANIKMNESERAKALHPHIALFAFVI